MNIIYKYMKYIKLSYTKGTKGDKTKLPENLRI